MKKYKVSNIKCENLTLLESAAIHLPESFTITTKKPHSKKELRAKIASVIKENYGEDLKSCVLEELEVSGPVINRSRSQDLTDRMEDYASSKLHFGAQEYSYNKEIEENMDQLSSILHSLGIFENVSEEYKNLMHSIYDALIEKFEETDQGIILKNVERRASDRLNSGL